MKLIIPAIALFALLGLSTAADYKDKDASELRRIAVAQDEKIGELLELLKGYETQISFMKPRGRALDAQVEALREQAREARDYLTEAFPGRWKTFLQPGGSLE